MVQGIHFLMKKNKITAYSGTGEFKGPKKLCVTFDTGVMENLTFDHCIIATGATPAMLPGITPGPRVMTYEQLIMSPNLPRSVIIVGGGAIGTEFAYILASYGVSVTVVETQGRLLPMEDAEVSAEVTKAYKALGITIHTSSSVDSIIQDMKAAKVTISSGENTQQIEADQVMIATGFQPRTTGYGLESTGVELTEQGAISIDAMMKTSVPGLYAIGDVTGKLMLAHVAEAQGVVAAEAIAGGAPLPLDYDMIPRAIYGEPQVASFGYTEAQAKEKGNDVRVSKFPFAANGKAWALGKGTGFVKIVADATHNEILGAHMVGPDVTELLPELTLACTWDLTADEIARTIHAHPTLSEALKEAAEGVGGQMTNF
jgi:dihydrolipoamide dehydrogenase